MSGLTKLVALLVFVALVAGLSCWTISYFFIPRPASVPSIDSHHWLHQQLDLTADQDKALDEQEKDFARKKKLFTEEIQQANAELAQALTEDQSFSPKVQSAVEKIHHAQSDLEKATLEHIFAMKPILTQAQFDKLLKLTGEALKTPYEP